MSDHLRGYGWRHATWCRWEKAQGTCDCGLREHQDAASPPAADPLDVERLAQALRHTSWRPGVEPGQPVEDYWPSKARNVAAEYARLAREGEVASSSDGSGGQR